MKVYNLAPMYLSSIQQGIQAAHAQVKLVKKYSDDTSVQSWVDSPTTVCLNGGSSIRMHEFKDFLEMYSTLPWTFFREDEESLEGLLTNICILVPEHVSAAYYELVENKEYLVDGEYVEFETLEDFFTAININTPSETLTAYEEFTNIYGELNIFEVLLSDRLRSFKLAH